MREIKFEYGFQSVNGIVKKVYHLHEIPNIKEKCDVWNVLPIAYAREYTGLKDRNGKEIYEGDILKPMSLYAGSMRVKFIDGSFICNNRFGKWGILSRCFDYDIKALKYDCEIIGNIYENPELCQTK